MIITIIEKFLYNINIIDIINEISKEILIQPFYNYLSEHYLFKIENLRDLLSIIDILNTHNIKVEICKGDTKDNYILNLNRCN